jgi:uncharacterized repeat protein (TIGR03803 family)
MHTLFVAAILISTRAFGQKEKILYSFPLAPNGLGEGNPYAAPILDSKGNLYGTALSGGAYNVGSVFELSPGANGVWVKKDLHSFNSDGQDGIQPYSSLVMESSGNLYGTTFGGGVNNLGTVFQLHPNSDGSWTETILHSFNADGIDGYNPYANLAFDKAGNLYGTTYSGGSGNQGTVFELSRQKDGTWLEHVILSFNYTDGGEPYGGLVFDAHGNIYGTTQSGGDYQHGVVFALRPGSNGTWNEQVLHSFDPSAGDGFEPYAGLVIDTAGHLYGTTLGGGANGTVYKVANVNGSWQDTVIHSFNPYNGGDGIEPYGPLAIDTSGNLYGTTWQSLFNNVGGAGIVFGLSQTKPNVWQETVLHNFVNPGDGGNPYSGVALDSTGHIFGTTYYGGVSAGVVFEITKLATTTTLTSSTNPSFFGQSVILTAIVKSASGIPIGTVTFKNGSKVLGTNTLSGGVAKHTASLLAVGTDAITAHYNGSTTLAPSASAILKQVVGMATTTTTLVSSLNPSVYGRSVTFTATIKPEFSGTPTGTVTFKNGNVTLGAFSLVGGISKYTTTSLPVGTDSITAVYGGSTSFNGSTSAVLEQAVTK